jgi:hypothetical protein
MKFNLRTNQVQNDDQYNEVSAIQEVNKSNSEAK